jgi:hypothetical protein
MPTPMVPKPASISTSPAPLSFQDGHRGEGEQHHDRHPDRGQPGPPLGEAQQDVADRQGQQPQPEQHRGGPQVADIVHKGRPLLRRQRAGHRQVEQARADQAGKADRAGQGQRQSDGREP